MIGQFTDSAFSTDVNCSDFDTVDQERPLGNLKYSGYNDLGRKDPPAENKVLRSCPMQQMPPQAVRFLSAAPSPSACVCRATATLVAPPDNKTGWRTPSTAR